MSAINSQRSVFQPLARKDVIWGILWSTLTTLLVIVSILFTVFVFSEFQYKSLATFRQNITVDQHIAISFTIISALLVEFIYRITELRLNEDKAITLLDFCVGVFLVGSVFALSAAMGIHRGHELDLHAQMLNFKFVEHLKSLLSEGYVVMDQIINGSTKYNFTCDDKNIDCGHGCLRFANQAIWVSTIVSVVVRILITYKRIK